MRLLKFQHALVLAMTLGGLSLAGPAWGQVAGGLTGKATLQNGEPCAKCTIQIERLDVNATYHVKTDKKGSYVYIGLPIGKYKVTLLDPNGTVLYYIDNFHIGLGDPTPLNFDLPKQMKAQAQANPEAAKAAVEQEKEQKQFAGLKQLFEQGTQAEAAKNYQAAIDDYQKAMPLATGRNVQVLLSKLGDAYHNAHQYDQAIATYQKVLQLSPTDANTYNNIGSTYADMGKAAEAQQAFEKAASLDPTHAATYFYNLGVIEYNQGNMDQAGAAFKKAIAADPKYADAYFYEGQAMLGKATTDKNGKIVALPGTVEAYKTYLQLDPSGANASVAQQMIQTLQGTVETQYNKRKKGKD